MVDSELMAEPGDSLVTSELLATERIAKREIRYCRTELQLQPAPVLRIRSILTGSSSEYFFHQFRLRLQLL